MSPDKCKQRKCQNQRACIQFFQNTLLNPWMNASGGRLHSFQILQNSSLDERLWLKRKHKHGKGTYQLISSQINGQKQFHAEAASHSKSGRSGGNSKLESYGHTDHGQPRSTEQSMKLDTPAFIRYMESLSKRSWAPTIKYFWVEQMN